ncbi:13614_t:CDS:1, partial [Cetraspora pellucida]
YVVGIIIRYIWDSDKTGIEPGVEKECEQKNSGGTSITTMYQNIWQFCF